MKERHHPGDPRPVDEPIGPRIERDSLGELPVPAAAFWGIQTQRAVGNFPVSGWTS